MEVNTVIKINEVSKYYDKFLSLDSVSAEIEKGSIFGLVGSNGSGKSTLLRIMSGIFTSDGGEVLYGGDAVYENPSVKKRVLYLSDEQYFYPHSTLLEMKNLYKSVYEGFDEQRFKKLCNLFALNPMRRLSTFSKGMQKQSSFLLALSCRPDYLLCDETFDGLDPVMRALVKRIIAEESAERSMTTVIASHNLRELEDICDHIALLHKSKILFVSDVDTMKENIHTVQAVFPPEFSVEALADLKISGYRRRGSMISFVCRGSADETRAKIEALSPEFYELIPLTLEEIFISEMEEKGYDFSKLDI
jgi:ABC-2 type transport system ATP-binding protein